jgi:hypothetical protein
MDVIVSLFLLASRMRYNKQQWGEPMERPGVWMAGAFFNY